MTYPNDDESFTGTGVVTVTKFMRPNPQTGVLEEVALGELVTTPSIPLGPVDPWYPSTFDPALQLANLGDLSRLEQKIDHVLAALHSPELAALRRLDAVVREWLLHEGLMRQDLRDVDVDVPADQQALRADAKPTLYARLLQAVSDVNEARGVK